MKKERIAAAVSRMTLNNGQLDWLPKNPRQWTAEDVERTRRSIDEDLDFLEDRPPLVIKKGDQLVVFAGNLRLSALRKTAIKSCPVILYTPETDEDRDTIKRRAMKDNGSFGSWDYDALANEWDDLPLADWGIQGFIKKDDEIPNDLDAAHKNDPFVCKITFPDAYTMTDFITTYKNVLEDKYDCILTERGGEL